MTAVPERVAGRRE